MLFLQQNSWVLAKTNHHFCFDTKHQVLSRVFQWGKKSNSGRRRNCKWFGSYPGQDWPVRNLQKTNAFPETLKSSLDFTYVLESITCILRTKPIFRLYSCRQFAESQLKIVELNRKKMDITRSSETYWKKKNLVYNLYALARLKGSFYCRFLDIRLWWTL